jgi:aspartate aminotransferase-like enzyme
MNLTQTLHQNLAARAVTAAILVVAMSFIAPGDRVVNAVIGFGGYLFGETFSRYHENTTFVRMLYLGLGLLLGIGLTMLFLPMAK